MPRQAGHNTRPQARLPPSFAGDKCMDDLTTECNSDMQAICGSLMYLPYLMLSMVVCMTRHWQASDRISH